MIELRSNYPYNFFCLRKFDIVVDFFTEIPYPLFSGVSKDSCFGLYFYASVFSFSGRFALIRCVFRPSLSPIA